MQLLSSKNEPQWLEYFNLVFLEIQNVTIRSVLLNLVTNGEIHGKSYKAYRMKISLLEQEIEYLTRCNLRGHGRFLQT